MSRFSKDQSAKRETRMARMSKALALVQAQAEKAIKGKVLQMPLWPADLVGTPNLLLRYALFGLMKHTKADDRKIAVQELIASVSGSKETVKVWFTGRRFNQTDLDFFECVLQLAGSENTEVTTLENGSRMMGASAYQLLKMAGRRTNKRDYQALEESMLRLREGAVRVLIKREAIPAQPGFPGKRAVELDIGGPLLLHAREGSNGDGRHLVAINPLLQPLFAPGNFTLINLPLRVSLQKDLSKWLLGFYSSHAKPLAYSLTKLHSLCGSSMNNSTKWRELVTGALEELVKVGFLISYELDANGNVHVTRAPEHVTRRQMKSLEPKPAAAAVDPRQQSLL